MDHSVLLLSIGLLCSNFCHISYGFSLNPSRYSGNGDPAPGRSPGPPYLENGDHVAGTEVPEDQDVKSECQLDGTFEHIERTVVNVTVAHHLFKTDVVVPGVTYEGKLTNIIVVVALNIAKPAFQGLDRCWEKEIIQSTDNEEARRLSNQNYYIYVFIALLFQYTFAIEFQREILKTLHRGNGDPAPGRSPGPPYLENGDHVAGTEDPEDQDVKPECQLDGTFKHIERTVVNVTVAHHLFKTDVVVPGVTYEGK
ncbi:hypothetical protein JTB14_036865 [Gonioctena quinquepunctata]|nr:hypothetical protein JTB14_036865 [Gonioctena quinquepunctata]